VTEVTHVTNEMVTHGTIPGAQVAPFNIKKVENIIQ